MPGEEQEGHRPHHMKFGHVEAAGFDESPSSCDEAEEEAQQQELQQQDGPSSSQASSSSRRAPEDPALRHARRMEQQDARRRRVHEDRRYFFRRPRALQYFRGNVLVRSEDERSSHRLELFFDLVFVGLIAVLAQEAVHEHNGYAIVRYVITYMGAWMIWNYMREVFNSFFVDDMPQRFLILVVMCCLVVYGNNATEVEKAYAKGGGARETAIGAYLVAGGIIMFTGVFYSVFVCQYRAQLRALAINWVVAMAIWIGAIFVSVKAAIAMVAVALALEYGGWLYFFSPAFKRLMNLRYSSAVAIEHEVERFNDFVTLVHGEFLYGVVAGQPAGHGMHTGVARTIFTVFIAFAIHGMYCNGAGSRTVTHGLRKSMARALLWFTLHLPFVSALTLCGDSTAELISETEVPQGVRWIFSASYAIAMISLTLIAYTECDHDEAGVLWFPKSVRICPRVIAALVVLFLPLADQEQINSTALLGIAAALTMAAWIFQELGSLDGPKAPWYTGHESVEQEDRRQWKGYPTFAEPGAWKLDTRTQRGPAATFSRSDNVPQQDP
jgi:low temperature requirement protein LtrA